MNCKFCGNEMVLVPNVIKGTGFQKQHCVNCGADLLIHVNGSESWSQARFPVKRFKVCTNRIIWMSEIDTTGIYDGGNNIVFSAKGSVYEGETDPRDGVILITVNDTKYVLPPNSYDIVEGVGDFKDELKKLLNCHSSENFSNTPDFILANYLMGCLIVFDQAINRREQFYGRPTPGAKDIKEDEINTEEIRRD